MCFRCLTELGSFCFLWILWRILLQNGSSSTRDIDVEFKYCFRQCENGWTGPLHVLLPQSRGSNLEGTTNPVRTLSHWSFPRVNIKLPLFFKNLFYWTIVDLQHCVSFRCTANWFCYTYVYILFHILFRDGLSQDIEYSSLCGTVGPCCLSILYIIVCIC